MMNLQHEFPLDEHILYLNHAAVAPWPARTRDRVIEFAMENTATGATHYPRWLKLESQLRTQLATLIGAPSTTNIALQKSTSEGLSAIAYGLDWQPGDKIVITDQEFPSNRIVWESLNKLGVSVVEACLNGENPESTIISLLDSQVKLLAVSSVQYGTGLALDLETLGRACRERDILFCVDAIQSLGAMPFDVTRNHADFVVADGHKWMLGPEGLALFYCGDNQLNRLTLHQYGWHMVAERGNYDTKDWRVAEDATRFECGSPNMTGVAALSASLGILLEYGIENVHTRILENIRYLEALLQDHPNVQLVTNIHSPLRSGILTFTHAEEEPSALLKTLMQAGVICAARGGGIRFSPHFYTTKAQLERAVELIP